MSHAFADRLMETIQKKNTRLCVGLDPHASRLPSHLLASAASKTDDFAGRLAMAIVDFNREIIKAVAEYAACVKPQIAFYERLGVSGWVAYQTTLEMCREHDLLVIADGKRGDIGSTARAYSGAHLGLDDEGPASSLVADALTVNAYMGMDTLVPFLDACKQDGTGIFVLVKTSNPGSGDFQDLKLTDGRCVYEAVADAVEAVDGNEVGESGFGPVGAVVGATYPEQLGALRKRMPHAVLLVPGFGAQGGSAKDIAGAFDSSGMGAVVNSSRGVIFAFQETGVEKSFAAAAETAAKSARDTINNAIGG